MVMESRHCETPVPDGKLPRDGRLYVYLVMPPARVSVPLAMSVHCLPSVENAYL